ncbi:hypothetical protein [Kribbella deserti]|uniref:Uncharacterized protein n=1 Tax=Kribbella deserti TaxID=1926257 RepID=A0ABV6QS40_9ACTN
MYVLKRIPNAAVDTAVDRQEVHMDLSWIADFFHWWTTARVGATAGGAGAAAAVIGATSGMRTLRRSRTDSQARSRPMVAAELRQPPYVQGSMMLVIKNYGPSIARNIRVTFDPEIPDPDDPKTSIVPPLKRRYSKPIPVLTPGMELDNLYYVGEPGAGGKFANSEGTPLQITVRFDYEGDDGSEYSDTFPLDCDLLSARTYIESSKSPDSQRKRMVAALETIAKKIE